MSGTTGQKPIWGRDEIEAYLTTDFPQVAPDKGIYVIEDVTTRTSRVRLKFHEAILRPGGTIQGPALMALADIGAYVVLMGAYGEQATDAVTTTLQTDFLRKPGPDDVVAETELVKAGRTLAVCHVRALSAESGDLLAMTNCTYAMPRQK